MPLEPVKHCFWIDFVTVVNAESKGIESIQINQIKINSWALLEYSYYVQRCLLIFQLCGAFLQIFAFYSKAGEAVAEIKMQNLKWK